MTFSEGSSAPGYDLNEENEEKGPVLLYLTPVMAVSLRREIRCATGRQGECEDRITDIYNRFKKPVSRFKHGASLQVTVVSRFKHEISSRRAGSGTHFAHSCHLI